VRPFAQPANDNTKHNHQQINKQKEQIMKKTTLPVSLALLLVAACSGQKASTNHSSSMPATMAAAPQNDNDIVDTAVNAGQFKTLVAALQAAELDGALRGDGPFTVFAPTDEAFAKLPAGTVEALLQDKDKLAQILAYHVVSGKVMAADVGGLDSAKTLQGQSLSIDTSDGVRIGGAGVVTADVVASNGVIHIIDTVLIPN
jgi:uncharacterized surface protein with fasciclin (FAS1) repeats